MSGYVVEVEIVDDDDDPRGIHFLYGPFKSEIRALEFAGKIGYRSGLNHNNFGAWAGTDGTDKTAWVSVKQVWSPTTNRLNEAIQRLLAWFLPEGESDGQNG